MAKQERDLLDMQTCKNVSSSDSESATLLRKKYDMVKKALACKEDVINQYATKVSIEQTYL